MINYRLLIITILVVAVLTLAGLKRLEIDTDVVSSLPTGEKVIADGVEIFEHHPIHDRIAVDVTVDKTAPDTLVEIGSLLEEKMRASSLFAQVGTEAAGTLIPELAAHAAANLPLLFTKAELEEKVAPRLEPNWIKTRLAELHRQLTGMEGIGQAEFIALDPLGLKDLVLAKLAPLAPSTNTHLYKGSLLSADNRHLLVVARPHGSGTDTASAREIDSFFKESFQEIAEQYRDVGIQPTFTPVGAYRAALDNERIIRHDVQLALLLATGGIGLLLLFAFPRPLIGLLSLVPAMAGVGMAIFLYSLVYKTISIMVLGFGGAVISITVDHGIAYLLFLDRTHTTRGREASVEVRAIGIMAVITSIGAFLILSFSGFPIFEQLGRFTALGILLSFVFVHSVFPRIFPTMPPGSRRSLPLHSLVDSIYKTGKLGAVAAILLVLVLIWFARPEFETSLKSMNTVSEATVAADDLFQDVWGGAGNRVHMMSEAESISLIQAENDRLLAKMEEDIAAGVLKEGFVPSMIFPGSSRAEKNLAAWRGFWDEDRRQKLREHLLASGDSLGFAPDAFAAFFDMLDPAYAPRSLTIPARYHSLLGIAAKEEKQGFRQFVTVTPGNNYLVDEFFNRYGATTEIFDVQAFTGRLAEILVTTFTTMLAIIAAGAAVLVFFFHLNLPLTFFTLLPPLFAFLCTLGTLKLIGQPLDIPALMLSIVVFGMGIDYSIFCVRAHQRYRRTDYPFFSLVRVAVFMAGGSTLIGFGVLCLAEHSLLKSIGVTSLLGIGYSLIGTFLLLPPLLHGYFERRSRPDVGAEKSAARRLQDRYRLLEAYPRVFARLKLRFDPLFSDLSRMLEYCRDVTTILDIGCGYGVPACWCLERFDKAVVHGFDPDPERVRVASLATGERGVMTVGWAPHLPDLDRRVDIALLLDMLHYLDQETTSALLAGLYHALQPNGVFITRFVTTPPARPSWSWRLEDLRVKFAGGKPYYRSPADLAATMEKAGFAIERNEVSPDNPELYWIVARVAKEEAGGEG